MSPADPAPTRAHALRNREKLLTTARAAFADADGPVSLEGIARRAGVGIGTLYRHFPTREALVEAVYAAELDDLSAAVATLLDRFPPEVALRAWLDRHARFTITERGMLDTLRAGAAAGRIGPQSRDRGSHRDPHIPGPSRPNRHPAHRRQPRRHHHHAVRRLPGHR